MRRTVLGGLAADILPARRNITLVYTPGLASVRRGVKSDSLAKMCERSGWGFVRYDPTHSPGESTGAVRDATLGAGIRDLQAVLSEVPGDVVLSGASLGGFISAWVAAGVPWRPPVFEKHCRGENPTLQDRIRAVALFAPAVDIASRWAELRSCAGGGVDFPVPSRYVEEPIVLRNEAVDDAALYQNKVLFGELRRRNTNLLLVHGSRDDVVSLETAESWFKEVPLRNKELFVVNDDHRINNEFHRVAERVDALCRVAAETPLLWSMFPRSHRAFDM
jgi:pimeloyl-ACP methyl ester carboxylesterase